MQLALRKPVEAPPPRMAALAKLPLFLDLAGKRVVVAGGTAAASWKAELAAAAGAKVEVYATELDPEMQKLIASEAPAGSITHVPHAWNAESFSGAVVAFTDVETEDEARAFHDAARDAGALVNVIDKPAFCQFQLGSIVNRSPVVVAISTDGGSPILAQVIRRRIETLLPPTLAAWGALAKRLRAAVNERLSVGAMRRTFWERFAERAITTPEALPDDAVLARQMDDIAAATTSRTGRVTLVGAGPGDAELLTLKAVRAMQAADVILYDDLVSDEVLELARREAKRMAVGKRGQRESCRQADINALMIKLAAQGKHVVRLKSGDPMIFGRAGEEIAELDAHGIAVDVVPGVTSALAAAARLGVSLTHRDCAQSVRFVTGHARDGELPKDLDWRGLADPKTTLVFYMGGRTAPLIAKRLVAFGLPASTPVAAISGVSRQDEQRWLGSLGSLANASGDMRANAPVLFGIGIAFASARDSQADIKPDLTRHLQNAS